MGAIFEVGVYDYDKAFVVMPIQDAQDQNAASGEYDAALGSREADIRQEGRSEDQ